MATLPRQAPPNPVATLKNILFTTDFSAPSLKAFPYAAVLARKFGASVVACHIITPTSLVAAAPQAAPYLYEAERNMAERELAGIASSPDLQGLETKALVASGMLGDCLADEIDKNKIDLVVAGTHGRTGLRRLLLGSSAEEICRTAKCPVLTVGPDMPPGPVRIKRILAPTDLSKDGLRALPFVAKLAEAYDAQVTVLHVLPEETAGNPDTKELSQPVLRSMRHLFEPGLGAVQAEFVIESGETVETILRVAHEQKADLIAMGIRNTFLPGFHLRTSVAYRVMAASECPVVTCR